MLEFFERCVLEFPKVAHIEMIDTLYTGMMSSVIGFIAQETAGQETDGNGLGIFEFFSEFFIEIVLFIIVSAAIGFARRIRKVLREIINAEAEEAKKDTPAPSQEISPSYLAFPPGLSILEKMEYLEQKLLVLKDNILGARRKGASDEELKQAYQLHEKALKEMVYLEPEDELEDRFALIKCIGKGRMSVVWKAYDQKLDSFVAIKFVRYAHLRDESIVQQFKYTARIMHDIHTPRMAAVKEYLQELPSSENRKIAYYVLEFVEGIQLDEYLETNTENRDFLIEGLMEIGKKSSGFSPERIYTSGCQTKQYTRK